MVYPWNSHFSAYARSPFFTRLALTTTNLATTDLSIIPDKTLADNGMR
jgi:hypothetical protein